MTADCVEGNILKQALQLEQESRELYLSTARKVENKLGRQMLESIARDEEEHHTRLLQLQEGAAGTALDECRAEFQDAGVRVRSLFRQYGDQAAEEVAAETDDLEALNITMEMERKGYNLYKEAAGDFPGCISGGYFMRTYRIISSGSIKLSGNYRVIP